MQTFRELAGAGETARFMIGAELVSTRGYTKQDSCQKVIQLGEDLADFDRVDWVSVTENAGGNPMLAPLTLGCRIKDRGTDVVIHVTCKDRNRNALESLAWHYASEGFDNVLCLTGDYPIDGYDGLAQPVFDLDSVTTLQLFNRMNEGLKVPGRKPGSILNLEPTNFFLGCAVSPFKTNEAELLCQYWKLEAKLAAGASFIIPQLGYDMRKSHELLLYLQQMVVQVPIFGNVYLLTKTVAGIFNKQRIPGCQVSDAMMERVKKEAGSPDKGKGFFLELAAKQVACFKGLGYRGAYIGGFHKAEDMRKIIEIYDTFAEDDWREFARDLVYPSGEDFHLFSEDPSTGLADASKPSAELEEAGKNWDRKEAGVKYSLNRLVHSAVFDANGALHGLAKAIYERADRKPGLQNFLSWNERVIKTALFACQDCGDCSLAECHYLCPLGACRKNQRNGPCGGSRGPLCESVDRNCIWYRAYQRAKKFDELDHLLKRKPIVCDARLKGTSSWANYFLGRDHTTRNANGEDPTAAKPEKMTDKTTPVKDNKENKSA